MSSIVEADPAIIDPEEEVAYQSMLESLKSRFCCKRDIYTYMATRCKCFGMSSFS